MDSTLSKIDKVTSLEEAVRLLYQQIPQTQSIDDAIELAKHAHTEQFRKSGEPYIIHPVLVAAIVASISSDEAMVTAAILHDVVEDTHISLDEIRQRFGDDVVHLVDGMTKIDEIRGQKLLPSDKEGHLTKSALSFRKILLASTKDVRVLVVKLCDRLHNMMTLEALSEAKQKRIAEETMVVYAPIAHRLGVSSLKRELEDLSFKYLFPDEFQGIQNYIVSHNQDFLEIINTFIKNMRRLMLQHGFEEDQFQLFGRVKHFYSSYLKMQRKGVSIEEVLDLLAVRILVKDPIDCYTVIGLVHLAYKPLMARFKDYVSVPKENGYQTIHTTVFDDSSIIEVQVRTFQMHQTAELGVAAHWKYKTGGHAINLEWLSNLSMQGENVELFMDLAQKDLFSEDIMVYSPKGESFTLPRGAVALDFAYAIHTDVGDKAVDALINKSKKSLLTELKNGDMVTIVTNNHAAIRCTWIDAVRTAKARQALTHNCNIRMREVDMMGAANIVTAILGLNQPRVLEWLAESDFVNSFYKASYDVGYVRQVIVAYLDELRKNSRFRNFLSRHRFKLKEVRLGHLLFYSNHTINDVSFQHCCHPKKGDAVIAFKKGSTAEVHHKMCDTALKHVENSEPMLLVRWDSQRVYKYHLIVSLVNSQGALAKFLLFLAKIKIDILSIELGNKKEDEIQYCTLFFETGESNINALRTKIEQKSHIIEFVHADDIYQK